LYYKVGTTQVKRTAGFLQKPSYLKKTFGAKLGKTASLSERPLPPQYGPSPRQNNISAAGVRYLGVVFNV
jgi:hypothetical protein